MELTVLDRQRATGTAEGAEVGVVAIMAPTYLPWVGYFDMIDQADCFVYLDTVQFNKRSWQQRNRVKGPDGVQWLSVPVLSKGKYHQLLSEVELNSTVAFGQKHLRTIEFFYRKAPFYDACIEPLREILLKEHALLIDLNIELIDWCCERLGITTGKIRSSELGVGGKKAELLYNITRALDADCYLSATGSQVFIDENDLFAANDVGLRYHHYLHPQYRQLHGDFVPYMSALDLLFNEGPESLAVIRSTRKD